MLTAGSQAAASDGAAAAGDQRLRCDFEQRCDDESAQVHARVRYPQR
jgi:hypothetical protein